MTQNVIQTAGKRPGGDDEFVLEVLLGRFPARLQGDFLAGPRRGKEHTR
jgi:hypothetical protein